MKQTTVMVALGREVQKQFGQEVYQGRITRWPPGSKDERELWKIVYEDEDVDTHGLVRILKVPATQTEQKLGVEIMQAATKEKDIPW
jgi:hypothetical protein